MLPFKDEMVLNFDGIIDFDPQIEIRRKAQEFIASRQWSTPSIFYGDQSEPEYSKKKPAWSITFLLGLDHVRKTNADWFSDVAAIIEFLQPVANQTGSEFIIEFRLKSRLWYSETLDFINDNLNDKVNLKELKSQLIFFTEKKSWWKISDSTFLLYWSRQQLRGRNRFILAEGICWWSLSLAFCLAIWFGHGITGKWNLILCILGILIGLGSGWSYSTLRWYISELRFKKLYFNKKTE